MPCFHPIPALQVRAEGEVVLWPAMGKENLQLPCGTCIGCRQLRVNQWATRCMHEMGQHEHNSFVTLTYDEKHVPYDGGLIPRHLSSFLWAVRYAVQNERMAKLLGTNVRYVACGEYGDTGTRPHYHALLFGVGFDDAAMCGKDLYTSRTLEYLWGRGNVSFRPITRGAAAYVAQYALKKKTRQKFITPDGVIVPGPFLRASTRPGIGAPWVENFRQDARHGYIVSDGKKVAVPRYYQKKMKDVDPKFFEKFRKEANRLGKAHALTERERIEGEKIAKSKHDYGNSRRLSTL